MSGTWCFLGIGSNLGDRLGHLQHALDALAAEPRIRVVAVSPVYETEPVGGPPQGDFLNAVVEIETDLAPHELLHVTQLLEQAALRVREERWGPRTLDVDILVYGEERVSEPDLEIPHPRMAERSFVLAPLHDLAPDHVRAPEGGWTGVRRAAVALRVP
ncbi:MAG: 2-amino-4-hydroxy-6-hydroxymethyldihydropteridine diphosphokinase [Actinobacteria bacterium]|nr:2-amino-4-hydroxy-6-hydroxymethyldihydropteridine diphosphokinase [Actinomycetota bacterium]